MTRIILLVTVLILPCVAHGIDLESRIKATFLYKFCQYVTWPAERFESPEAPIVIAIIEARELAEELRQTTEGRTINNRSLLVRLVEQGEPLDGVHVLFAGSGILVEMAGAPQRVGLLTVTDVLNDDHSGIINFVTQDNKVRFDIAQHKAEQAGLKLSSQLLSVARHVTKGG